MSCTPTGPSRVAGLSPQLQYKHGMFSAGHDSGHNNTWWWGTALSPAYGDDLLMLLTGLASSSCSASFLCTAQAFLPRAGAAYSELGPSASPPVRRVPYIYTTGQSELNSPSGEAPSFLMTRGCVAVTRKAKHHRRYSRESVCYQGNSSNRLW